MSSLSTQDGVPTRLQDGDVVVVHFMVGVFTVGYQRNGQNLLFTDKDGKREDDKRSFDTHECNPASVDDWVRLIARAAGLWIPEIKVRGDYHFFRLANPA